ncbi:MAG: hypothetical protein JO297_03395 [Nitrososphaeraceae archaeon]|nr:hypothetical protein [Nitrososphaeraceae archaeon]
MGGRVNTKAPLREKKGMCPNSVDRAKSGTEHIILVDGKGMPPSVSIDGSNIHSMKMT